MQAKLRRIAAKLPDRVAAALYREAEIEMTESKRRCPVKYGTLRASGMVSLPVQTGKTISVTLSYGGAAEKYAVIVHENLEAIHPIGQAKFLESVLNESAPFMAERVSRRVRLESESE